MTQIGLTGGIGSGKTTVARLLVGRGAVVIDADAIVRELQEPGRTVYEAIVDHFGDGVVDDAGRLDRKAIAAIVFADEDQLNALNDIVHPAVGVEMERRRSEALEAGHVVVSDIPLLIGVDGEVNARYRDSLDGVIVVDVDVDVAVERLVEGRGFDAVDARARIANQATRAQRRAVADFVVDNSGGPDELEAEVDRCWRWIGSLTERETPER